MLTENRRKDTSSKISFSYQTLAINMELNRSMEQNGYKIGPSKSHMYDPSQVPVLIPKGKARATELKNISPKYLKKISSVRLYSLFLKIW